MFGHLRIAAVSLLVACAAPPAAAPPPDVSPPPAAGLWSLSFEYKPSGRPAPGWFVPWSTTIGSSGRCELSVKRWDEQLDNFMLVTEPRTIAAADLSALHAALQDARIEELAPFYGDLSVTDQDSMTMTYIEDAMACTVKVYGPVTVVWDESRDGQHERALHPGKRFLSVVVAILRNVPSPIAMQTPDKYADLLRDP